jgi:hypothetical protein
MWRGIRGPCHGCVMWVVKLEQAAPTAAAASGGSSAYPLLPGSTTSWPTSVLSPFFLLPRMPTVPQRCTMPPSWATAPQHSCCCRAASKPLLPPRRLRQLAPRAAAARWWQQLRAGARQRQQWRQRLRGGGRRSIWRWPCAACPSCVSCWLQVRGWKVQCYAGRGRWNQGCTWLAGAPVHSSI